MRDVDRYLNGPEEKPKIGEIMKATYWLLGLALFLWCLRQPDTVDRLQKELSACRANPSVVEGAK